MERSSKRCTRCQEVKPLDEFYSNRRNPDGLYYECKACWKKIRGKDGRGYRRAAHLRQHYGITEEEHDDLLEEQGGCCAICGVEAGDSKSTRLHVDHDHDTGRVRGLLCTNCNNGLGRFKDDPALLLAAVSYLMKHAPIEEEV